MVLIKNDFNKQNNKSHSAEVTEFWLAVYMQYFSNMVCWMSPTQKCKAQFAGIDRVILLDNSRTVFIDEKIREKEWGDILFEYVSNNKTMSKGWMDKDLTIDYLAYGFLDTEKAYIFDWRVLKRIWRFYKNKWIAQYPKIEAKNKGYTTISVAVPISEVLKRYQGAILIKAA